MKSVIFGVVNGFLIVCLLSFLARLFFPIAALSDTRAAVFGASVWIVGIAGGIYVGRAHARRSRQ